MLIEDIEKLNKGLQESLNHLIIKKKVNTELSSPDSESTPKNLTLEYS